MKKLQLLGLPLLLVFIQSCGQNENQKEWNSIVENGYSIKYPKTWELNKSGSMEIQFVLLSKSSGSKDKYRENVSLMVLDFQGVDLTLDKFVGLFENQIKSKFTNGSTKEIKRIKKNKLDCYKIIFTGNDGALNLKHFMYCWFVNNKIYLLMFVSEVDEYEKVIPVGIKIMDSFKINL